MQINLAPVIGLLQSVADSSRNTLYIRSKNILNFIIYFRHIPFTIITGELMKRFITLVFS